MFEFVRKHNRVLQLVLLVIVVPSFVLVGIEGYRSFSGQAQEVAHVNGSAITQTEWDAEHRRRVEHYQQRAPHLDPKVFASPPFKREVLEGLISQKVLHNVVNEQQLFITDARLQRLFTNDPQWAPMRNPDGSVNPAVLAQQGMSSAQLAARLRQDYALQQVLGGVGQSVPKLERVADLGLDALLQQREIQWLRISRQDFESKVQVTDDILQQYYSHPAHAQAFDSPEKVDVEYVVLDLEAAKKGVQPADEDLRKYYTENQARYKQPEERHARHILIKVDEQASAQDREKAKEKAQTVLAQARKAPASFAELARKFSDDSGSATQGGDLGFFGRGAMVPAFDEAVFAMKPGEISEVVSSEFGLHIVQLLATRGGQQKTFEQVHAQIREEVQSQLARQRYGELAEQFTNIVYEQFDSLQPVADKLQLPLQKATDVLKQPAAAGGHGPLAQPSVLAALFDPENIRQRRNINAIEVAPSQLVSARVLEHKPAQRKSFDEVKAQVRDAVVKTQSQDLALKAGEAKLAAAKESGQLSGVSAPMMVSRRDDQGIGPQTVDAVLKANLTDKTPVWIGLPQPDGYFIARINKLVPPDAAVREGMRGGYAQAWGQAEQEAALRWWRHLQKVRVDAKLDAQEP